MVAAWCWREREWGVTAQWPQGLSLTSFFQMKRALETDGGGGHASLWTYVMPLTYATDLSTYKQSDGKFHVHFITIKTGKKTSLTQSQVTCASK